MAEKRTSVFENSLIWFGAGVSLAEILTGTYFAPLGFAKGTLAILIGHVIGCTMLFLSGLIGGKLRQSSMETVKRSFGQRGGQVGGVVGALGLVPGGQRRAHPLQGIVHALGIAALEQRGGGGQRGRHAQRPHQDQRLAVQPRHALGACGAAFVVTHRRPPC